MVGPTVISVWCEFQVQLVGELCTHFWLFGQKAVCLLCELASIKFSVVGVKPARHFCHSALISFVVGLKASRDLGLVEGLCRGGRELDGHLGWGPLLSSPDILFDQVLLKLSARFALIAVVDVEDELLGVHSFYEVFELTVVRMRRVGHLVVQRYVAVVLVIPPGQNDEHCGLLLVALVNTKPTH